jgi:hypothetical protein
MGWALELIIALVAMPVADVRLSVPGAARTWWPRPGRQPPPPDPLGRLQAGLRRLRAELEDAETAYQK